MMKIQTLNRDCNLKGARTAKIRGATDNVTRYYKNGKYLDKTVDGKIISFGKQ